jgi:hypothetical protein
VHVPERIPSGSWTRKPLALKKQKKKLRLNAAQLPECVIHQSNQVHRSALKLSGAEADRRATHVPVDIDLDLVQLYSCRHLNLGIFMYSCTKGVELKSEQKI